MGNIDDEETGPGRTLRGGAPAVPSGKCHQCDECRGLGCSGELPGMGGAFDNEIFRLNCSSWDAFRDGSGGERARMRLAPITGAVQNLGCAREEDFYRPVVAACAEAGIALSIGDGCPDEKLLLGIEALRASGVKGAVFIKPYSNRAILERMDWCAEVAEYVGVDIDSYRIATMRGLVSLYRKSVADLLELKRMARVPFAVKGILLDEDLELLAELRPDVAVVSNHGGRVETLRRAPASFLAARSAELRRCAGEVWVDGGARRAEDLAAARRLGAAEVLIGRPVVSAFLRGGREAVVRRLAEFRLPG